MTRPYQPVQAPRGTELSCQSWPAEAALRMLVNCLDPHVARDPERLAVHGGHGQSVRSWDDYDRIVGTLQQMKPDETLLVQSGRPIAVFQTSLLAPRVLIAHSLVAPAWSAGLEFDALRQNGLTIDGRVAAGSWSFTGISGFLATAYETLAEIADQHFDGSLAGRLILSGGLGASGAAQGPAAKIAKATLLVAEADANRIETMRAIGAIDHRVDDLDAAIDMAIGFQQSQSPQVIAWPGNVVELVAKIRERNIVPDVVTDMTGGLDALHTYVPRGMDPTAAMTQAAQDLAGFMESAKESVASHVTALLELAEAGSVVFEFANSLRAHAETAGVKDAYDFPGFYSVYLRARINEGRSPIGIVALTGEAEDLDRIDEAIREVAAEDARVLRYIEALHQSPVSPQGLPARTVWLKYEQQAALALLLNKRVRDQDISGPVMVLRGPYDPGTVTSPFRETEQLPDGSDAIADWPVLAALLNAASGATIVSVGHGGGSGAGYSMHASNAVLANGSPEADLRLKRVLTSDPAFGLLRYRAAGEPEATATVQKLNIPAIS